LWCGAIGLSRIFSQEEDSLSGFATGILKALSSSC
jgi:hypothetical protein